MIESQGLTQAAAAKLLGVTQQRISDLTKGKIDRFSVDSLIEMLGHAGARVSFVVSRGAAKSLDFPSLGTVALPLCIFVEDRA